MKKLYMLITFLLPLSIGIYSCKPEEPPEPKETQTFLVWQEGWDYCYFLPGTWWVYQDSNSGAYDTMTVYEANKGLDSVKDNNGRLENVYEWFIVRISSSYSGYNYYFRNLMSFYNQVRRVKVRPSHAAGENIYYIHPSNIGNKLGYYYDISEVIDKKDSIFYLSKYYYNFLKISHTADQTEKDETVNYYMVKDIGYYRKEVGTSEVWKLINYKIVK